MGNCPVCGNLEEVRVALTMHDLPVWPHWTSSYGKSPEDIFDLVIAALEKHGVKEVYNMANSGTGLTNADTPPKTTLCFNPKYKRMFDRWCASGNYIGNHTHRHVAIYETNVDGLKQDILKADRELRPWISRSPTKMFCFCTDCQGGNEKDARELAAFLQRIGYRQLPAASMVWEWRWEAAYLGLLAKNDVDGAARLRREFVDFSVQQTLFDAARGKQRWGPDFVPTLLLHMLTIVADTLDEWIAAHKAAGIVFVSAEEALDNDLYTSLVATKDTEQEAHPALKKRAEQLGWAWPDSRPKETAVMNRVKALMKEAMDDGVLVLTKYLDTEETKDVIKEEHKF